MNLQNKKNLDIPRALRILEPEGVLSHALPGFEPREAQQNMMRNVLEAYNQRAITLIEAGTGTGKSMAYLIPAILWALQHKEKTVISTNTIALQEQLLYKDIPTLTKALKVDLKVVLVKGMNNYLCLRKLEEARQMSRTLPDEVAEEVNRIEEWSHQTREGSRSKLPFAPSSQVWEQVCAEHDLCSRSQCPYYQDCFFFQARKRAQDAQILIVNHHLLFADLVSKATQEQEKNQGILPLYDHVILDEAHHIEDVATDHFASRFSQLGILRLLGRLGGEKQGKLTFLKNCLYEMSPNGLDRELNAILSRLNLELPGLRTDLIKQIGDAFYGYSEFAALLQTANSGQEEGLGGGYKLRILPTHQDHPDWVQEIVPRTQQLLKAAKRYIQALRDLEAYLKFYKNERIEERTKPIRADIAALTDRLQESTDLLNHFLEQPTTSNTVKWIDHQQLRMTTNTQLVHADLDISSKLVEFLFSKFSTIIMCSATMTTNKQFQFIRKRFGLLPENLPNRPILEKIYESPFDYSKQALFAIPTNIPNPMQVEFNSAVTEAIWQIVQASRGNAFILFTSYSMLNACHKQLAERMQKQQFLVLKQGDANRHTLIERFKSTDRSVLFGTDSFWEGVDVVGEALRCVIIVKLPFKVPSEPLIQARAEAITANGGNPFTDYSLPQAVVKFKQGFGRLIRSKTDRGCIICMDSRLLSKNYGKFFLNSLPACQQLFADLGVIKERMKDFYTPYRG